MMAAVFESPLHMPVKEVARPDCPEGGLLVRVEACGLCGTDVRIFNHGHHRVAPPRIIGHEIAGVVEEVGKGVGALRGGERVMLFPSTSCGRCHLCQRGRANLCASKEGFGYEWDGGYAQCVAVGSKAISNGNVIPIPKTLSFEEATLVEPLSCCVNGQEKLNIAPQDSVLIIGAGPIGLMHLLLARRKRVVETLILELQESRTDSATAFNPDVLLDASDSLAEKRVLGETNGYGPDVVIVACSSVLAHEQAMRLVSKGGRVLFFAGLPADASQTTYDANRIHYDVISIFGSFASSIDQYRAARDLVSATPTEFRKMLTHRLPLNDVVEGIKLVQQGQGLKVVVKPQE